MTQSVDQSVVIDEEGPGWGGQEGGHPARTEASLPAAEKIGWIEVVRLDRDSSFLGMNNRWCNEPKRGADGDESPGAGRLDRCRGSMLSCGRASPSSSTPREVLWLR